MPKIKIAVKSQKLPLHIEKELKKRIQKLVGKDREGDKAFVANVINKEITKNFDKRNNIDFIEKNTDNIYITDKDLWRYIDKHESAQRRKLIYLLIFLNYDLADAENLLRTPVNNYQDPYSSVLEGNWLVYFRDSSSDEQISIKCAPMTLERVDKATLSVTYKTSWDVIINGTASVKGDKSLVFELRKDPLNIYICCDLPSRTAKLNDETWILNGATISNGKHNSIMYSLLLIKVPGKPNPDTRHINLPISSLKYRSLKPEELLSSDTPVFFKNQKLQQDAVNNVILFLSDLNKNITVPGFTPNTLQKLKEINTANANKLGRNHYEQLKTLLSVKEGNYAFFSFNHIKQNREKISVFGYAFYFDDAARKCIARRYKIGQPSKTDFEGEVVVHSETIYMSLTDPESGRKKFVLAKISYDSSTVIFKAITTTLYSLDYQPFGLREMLVCIPISSLGLNPVELANSYISYSSFLKIDDTLIPASDKLYLANVNQSSLTYPIPTNSTATYSYENNARTFSGTYIVYACYPHDNENSLFKIILTIDSLAQVEIKMKYQNENKLHLYVGFAELFASNIRVEARFYSTLTNEIKSTVMIFDDLKRRKQFPGIYTGIIIDTNSDEHAYACSFIAVRQHELSADLASPDIINRRALNKNSAIMAFFTKENISNFFWFHTAK